MNSFTIQEVRMRIAVLHLRAVFSLHGYQLVDTVDITTVVVAIVTDLFHNGVLVELPNVDLTDLIIDYRDFHLRNALHVTTMRVQAFTWFLAAFQVVLRNDMLPYTDIFVNAIINHLLNPMIGSFLIVKPPPQYPPGPMPNLLGYPINPGPYSQQNPPPAPRAIRMRTHQLSGPTTEHQTMQLRYELGVARVKAQRTQY